jgi:hypothetical protein
MARARTAAAPGRGRRAAGRRGAGRREAGRGGWLTGADRPALLLLAAWLAYRLFPYVPVLDWQKYWRALRPVLLDPLPHGSDPVRWCLLWLLCCLLVEAVAGAARTVRLFPTLAGAVFAARLVIADTALSSGEVAGACVAYVFWLLLFRRAPARNAILAVLLAALIVSGAAPRGWGWLAVADKFFVYGGLIWLLVRAGLRLTLATGATAVLVGALAAAHGPLRAAALGDAGVAVGVGALFWAAAFSRPRRSRP